MKKVLKISGIVLLVVILLIILLPFLFKGKLIEMAKEEINNNVNAKVEFGDFDLSLLSSFPDLNFQMEDLKISGLGQFEGVEMLNVGAINFDLDLMTVITGSEIKINEIAVDQLHLNAIVTEEGIANYDIAIPSEEAKEAGSGESSKYNLLLDKYSVTNSSILYDNQSLDMYLALKDLNHEGAGNISDQLYALKTSTKSGQVDVNYEGVGYISKAVAEINADFDITDNFGRFDLKANEIKLNNLILSATGSIDKPSNGMIFDVDYNAVETDLKNLLSLIPKEYMSDLDGLKTEGTIDIHGKIFGQYDDVNLPGFSVIFDIDKGRIQYPDLPQSIDQIYTNSSIVFPGGADFDAMVVEVKQLNMMIAKSPIAGRLVMKNPLSDPSIDASIDAQVNLAEMKEAIAMDDIENLSGIITADVDLKGKMSSIEKEQYEDFTAQGKVILQDMVMRSDSTPDVNITLASLDFSPQSLDLKNFDAKMGKSDFSLKGKINNYLAYYLKDEDLKGKFNLDSRVIDLNEYLSEEESVEGKSIEGNTEEQALTILKIPENIDVTLQSKIGKVIYDNFEMNNINGDIVLRDGEAKMNNVRMKVLGGDVVLDGSYSTKSGMPKIDFEYDVNRMDIKSTATTFNTVEKFAPLASKCTGKFSSDLEMSFDLDQNMTPDLTTIFGDGDLVSNSLYIEGFEPLNKLAEKLKIPELAKQRIDDINFTYELKDGKVFIKPFDVILDGMPSTVSGNSSITGEIDYNINMKVPISKLGSNATSYLSGLVGNINNLGLNLSVAEFVNMKVGLTGTMTKPKINIAVLGSEGQSVQESIVNSVKEEINIAKEEAIDNAKEKAREEAAKIIAEAQKRANTVKEEAKKIANRVRSEGQAAGDKLVEQAKNPFAKIAAQKASEKLVKEANKKADKIELEANTRADKLVADAKAKADQKLE